MAPGKFSDLLPLAFRFALERHAGQFRKGSAIPYVSHVFAVSALCLEFGGNESQAIAGLLHDTIEDCGVSESELAALFGPHVARLVADCSDHAGGHSGPELPYRERKERYIRHLADAHPEALLVSACDKLHNARAIVRDVESLGPSCWARFSAPPETVLWYYESLVDAFGKSELAGSALLGELSRELARLRALVPR